MKWLFVLISFLLIMSLSAQEQNSLDWDIDSIFDTTDTTIEETEPIEEENAAVSVINLVQQRGFYFSASFSFLTGVAPGWYDHPWSNEDGKSQYYLDRFIVLGSSISLDAQISDIFRVRSTISYQIPDFSFALGDFFFDYTLYNTVFFRAGKYGLSWGISPNFGFTNLLSRVPKDSYAGDSFIFKADIPISRGGFQVLTLTRANLMSSSTLPKMEDFGFGGKYNFAYRWADIDMGIFYREGMVLRSFLSLKTTVLGTELFNEWLVAIDVEEPSNISGAFNIGFARGFFNNKFYIGGELFFNAEKDTYWYQPETNIREAGKSPFIEGLNLALSLQYRPWEKGSPYLYLSTLIAPMQRSARIVPAFTYNPLPHIGLYFALPISLGDKDGYYFANTVTKDKNNFPLPFAFIFLVSLGGSIQFGYNY